MSRKGNCWGHAKAESFFRTLKTELIYYRKLVTRQEARLAVLNISKGGITEEEDIWPWDIVLSATWKDYTLKKL